MQCGRLPVFRRRPCQRDAPCPPGRRKCERIRPAAGSAAERKEDFSLPFRAVSPGRADLPRTSGGEPERSLIRLSRAAPPAISAPIGRDDPGGVRAPAAGPIRRRQVLNTHGRTYQRYGADFLRTASSAKRLGGCEGLSAVGRMPCIRLACCSPHGRPSCVDTAPLQHRPARTVRPAPHACGRGAYRCAARRYRLSVIADRCPA